MAFLEKKLPDFDTQPPSPFRGLLHDDLQEFDLRYFQTIRKDDLRANLVNLHAYVSISHSKLCQSDQVRVLLIMMRSLLHENVQLWTLHQAFSRDLDIHFEKCAVLPVVAQNISVTATRLDRLISQFKLWKENAELLLRVWELNREKIIWFLRTVP